MEKFVRSRLKSHSFVILPTFAFLVLGWAWAIASPPGSSADEGFHMSTIWCAWGPSESCEASVIPDTVMVPDRVANASCFAQQGSSDARCVYERTDWYVQAGIVDGSSQSYPPVYHKVLRAFVGPNVHQSVLLMRMFNVALAAGLLALALAVCKPVVRRAVALSWMVCLVPMGIFFIASINPSGWAITGGSLFWAFFYTLIVERTWRTSRAIGSSIGAGLCLVMALGARADSAIVLIVSMLACAAVAWPHLRTRMNRLWLGLLAIPLVIVAALFNVGRYLHTNLSFPPGNPEFDQPNALLKMLLELPSFLAGIVGGQSPLWSQRASANDSELPGFSWPGFSYGVGALDVQNPEISGLLVLTCVAGVIFLGFRSYSIRKIVAVSIVFGALIGQIIITRALAGFQPEGSLQPRYVFALVLVGVGFAAITFPRSASPVNRGQALLLVAALAIADSGALMATIGRFAYGQAHSWTGISAEPGWWWSVGPSPLILTTIGALAGLAWLLTMANISVQSGRRIAATSSS